MKILIDKYPMGSIPGQRTPGRYIDETLYENIKYLAKNIINDMTFLGICSSSTYEVGTGKSTFVQHIGEAYTDLVNQYHGTNIEFTMNNIVFRPKELIERSFKVQKYSCIILDEWEDAHYWSELGITLRQFFRKCRQLNLFIIIICPNFFQLPMGYAISRSIFFVDVKFAGGFERGYFSFYNFNKKKDLYIKGKKTNDYKVVYPDFNGRFTGGYVVNKEEYLDAKMKDTLESENRAKPLTEREIKSKVLREFVLNNPHFTKEQVAEMFNVNKRTVYRWLEGKLDTEEEGGAENDG